LKNINFYGFESKKELLKSILQETLLILNRLKFQFSQQRTVWQSIDIVVIQQLNKIESFSKVKMIFTGKNKGFRSQILGLRV
jgi:hypothetical protein